jgi:hypoxanthine phosphoribosyltransferase
MLTKISWEDIYSSCKKISHQCIDVDAIVAVSRGGLVPARILSELLNVSRIYSYGLSSYKEKESQDMFEYQSPLLKIFNEEDVKNIVVIDEIADSGKTFEYISNQLLKISTGLQKQKNFKFASLYVRKDCKFVPSIYHKIIQSADWLVFPWEKEYYA